MWIGFMLAQVMVHWLAFVNSIVDFHVPYKTDTVLTS
jgi:hypothetical protein